MTNHTNLIERLKPAGHWETDEGKATAIEYAAKTRGDLCHGDRSDLVVANDVFMAQRYDLDLIHHQTAAKERIRWLSVQLALSNQAISTLTAEVEAMRLAGNELADKAHLLTFASRDEPLNKVAKAALDAWFATLTKGEGDKP